MPSFASLFRCTTHRLAMTLALVGVLILTGCASPGVAQRMQERLNLFESVASEPVDSFHFWDLYKFETVSPEHVVVWTRIDTAYLIEVRQPCSGLDFAHVIGVSSTQNRVHSRFDHVLFENQNCRIKEIRPVDTEALKLASR